MLRLTLLSGRWRSNRPLLLGVLFALSCMHNRPDAPDVPVGPSSIEVDSTYVFSASASNGNQYEEHGLVWVRFDWGDGDTSPWCGHGETVECSHSWRDGGVYAVRAQAHDDRSEFSEWSAPLKVTAAVPPYPYRLVDSVVIGGALFDAQVLPNGKFVYVLDWGAKELSVVRTSDLHLVTRIPLDQSWWGDAPQAQVMSSPQSDYVYVTPYGYDYVGVVSTASQSVIDSLRLGEEIEVNCSAISLDGRRLYVAVDAESNFVVVFRLLENDARDTIFTLGACTSMAVAPDGSRLYTIDTEEWRVCAIGLSDNAIEWQVSGESPSDDPGALVVHPSGNLLYQLDEERVLVRESGTGLLVCNILVPSLRRADISPDGSYLYVTCTDSVGNGTVAVVQTSDNEVVRVIAMPTEVYDVAPSPDGEKLYVGADNGKLYVVGR